MTYKEVKEYGAICKVETTYHGAGDYLVCDSEHNEITGTEFFTKEEAEKKIAELLKKGYIEEDKFNEIDPITDEWKIKERHCVYTCGIWEDASDHLDDLIEEEENGIL